MEKDKNNLLPLIKKNNLMELFPHILNTDIENFKMTPSQFIKEMSLTTEERHKLLIHTCNTKQILKNNYPPQLRVIPNILVFQRCDPRSTNVVSLQIRNIGKTILPLKMHCPASLYFSATAAGTTTQKLAPGLSAEYKITFTPKEVNDYSHRLIFFTKEESFSVPIIAIGPRAILDIPDQIILNPAPVKLSVTKWIVIRNVGSIPASFTFITQSPFKVHPTKGYLTVNETMILKITFESSSVGEAIGLLNLVYESGEKLAIVLEGAAENANVRLEKNSILHEDTFLGLKRCKSLRLFNNSSSMIKFCWKKNKSVEDDLKIINSLKLKYADLAESTTQNYTKVKFFELSNFENHKNASERILKDELQMLEEEEFKFYHETFTIEPQKGEVWPKAYAEMIVSFEPKSCTSVCTEAYLEVSGREGRLPLQIRGLGLGPKIVLNPQTLDIDYIYLCSHHKYEVIAVNKGDIPGKLKHKAEASIFGGKIEVEPKLRHLNPGECGVFIISFTSNKQGEFLEQLTFIIQESGEMVSFILTGKIISPTLHFDRRSIDFGTIPFGFPTVQEVTLNNLSVVPVTFSLKVLRDGVDPSVSYKRFASLTLKPPLPHSPKEFHIDPEESVVEPFSSKKVTLTLTANKIGRFNTHLEMDMWDSESGSVSCPITYHAIIPTISADPESITIPFCFINFPYTRSIVLKNSSKVAGFFYIVPPNPNDSAPMTCSANIPQGTIDPGASLNIDITLITSGLGRQVVPINLLVFGYDGFREVCTISCIGQGPVVTVSPNNLHWGETPMLEEVQKTLVIANECPIPATLSFGLVKKNSPWTVNSTNLTLAPSESVSVDVNLFLNDRGKFKDILKVGVHNGKVLNIHLSATGIGSSLRVHPAISPNYDLGTLFSHKNYEIEVLVENRGTKPYGLVWSPFQDYSHFVSMKLINPSNLKFKFEPTKMDLMPGEHKTMNLIVQSSVTGFFSQMIYCFANIGVPTKELHFTTEIFAEFVEPLINFDKQDLKYWYNIGFDGTDRKLEDDVEISNMSVLPLRVHFSVRHPFRIISDLNESTNSMEVNLKGNKSKKLTIRFVPDIKPEPISRTYNGYLSVTFQEHSKKFTLALNGEVNYPNLMILPSNINFDFVPIASNTYREVTLVNISPLTVYYHISWNSTTSTLIETEKKRNSMESVQGVMESRECFEQSEAVDSGYRAPNVSEFNITNREETSENTPHLNNELGNPKMPKFDISKTDIKQALFPLAKNYYESEQELMNAYRMARSSENEPQQGVLDYSKVCDITPFYGKLEKFSSQILSVRFSSDVALTLHLEAMISIKSGPTETVTIDGIASEINFSVDTTELDFGKQLFCKPSSQPLRIRNTGEMPYRFEVNLQKECTFSDSIMQNTGVISVSPVSGLVGSFSEVELLVTYLPMVPGNFEKTFKLEIAYLDSIPIKIKGYGVFPQVHIALPRAEILTLSPEIGYIATASITPSWILTEFPGVPSFSLHYIKPYRSQESNLDSLDDFEKTGFDKNEWEFIKNLEYMPTDVEIQLAIERTMAIHLLSKCSENETNFAAYARSIPQFIVPAYETDFGTVVIGRHVEHTVTITNFGPLPAVFYVHLNSQLKEDGIQVRLKNRNDLNVGDHHSFSITFSPKKNKYKKQLEVIDNLFYLELYHGPKIPIKILATVTYPFLIASSKVLNYFDVVCGCCKVMNLKLKNPGLVPAYWSLVFLTNNNEYNQLLNAEFRDGRSMFHLNYKSGVLQPEEYCVIQISFKPDFEGSFTATLWVQVGESLEELKVLLIGEGVEPKLSVPKEIIKFGPTPPYPNKLDRLFTIENPCSFPIEFYFPTFDDQILEEDRIIRAVCTYYQSKELLLPVRKPGDGLPAELVNFYQMLVDDLNTKLLEEENERGNKLSMNTSDLYLNEADQFTAPSQIYYRDKSKIKTRKSLRTRTSIESSRIILEAESQKSCSVLTVNQNKNIVNEDMLLCHIRDLLNSNPDFDPIQNALKSTLPSPVEEEYKHGLLIIFHGAPYTNVAQLANRAAVATKLPTFSIDKIVMEEAAFSRCEVGLTARELIEEAYWDHIEVKEDSEFPIRHVLEGSERGTNFVCEFDEIERKLNALISLRENLISLKNKLAISPTSKSETSKKDRGVTPNLKPMNVNAPIANITEEVVIEILKFRLPMEVQKGMILESLQSVFINSHSKVLVSVLKAAGNISDIMTIFLLNNYDQHNQCLLAAEIEKENTKSQVREKLLDLLEEEDYEMVLNFIDMKSEEEQNQFDEIRKLFIEKRHFNHNSFEKNKSEFYESLKQKSEVSAKPNASFGKAQPEKKKEGAKAAKLTVPDGRAISGDKAGKGKKDLIELEFETFESELTEMKLLVENWDQRICTVTVEMTADSKTKKGQSPRRVGTQSSFQSERGIQLWLVDVSRPDKDVFTGVCCHLRTVLQNRTMPKESDYWPLASPQSMTFSVVPYPPLKKKASASDIYNLTFFEPIIPVEEGLMEETGLPTSNTRLNRSTSQISFRGKRRGCHTAKRKKEDQKITSDSKTLISKKLNSKSEGTNFKSRWVLLPGEAHTWRVRYFPMEPGETKQLYPVNVVNWQNNNTICCAGICDIPTLDMTPEIFYPHVATATPILNPLFAAYFYSEDAYDFGSIVYVQQNDGNKNSERQVEFTLLNKSHLSLDLTVTYGQDVVGDDTSRSSAYLQFDPDRIFLQPGESHLLNVTVIPQKYGPQEEFLLLLAKDNPKVELIKIKFEGVKANVTVEPKSVNFDRVLLHRKDYRELLFTNNNFTPLFIALSDLEDLPPQVGFSATRGWIAPTELLKIDVSYDAKEVQQIIEQPILVKVFDSESATAPVQELTITLSAEAYDVALDIIFAEKDCDHIDFGCIRAQSECNNVITLRNVGKYLIRYKIGMDYNFLNNYPDDRVRVSPEDGILQPGKTFPVTVTVNTKTEVSWQRVPLLRVVLLEPNTGDELIAKIPVEVSVKSLFPRYEIIPNPDYNFGHIKLGSLTTGALVLKNTGYFPLSYLIEGTVSSVENDGKPDESLKKTLKVTASSKEKEDKGKKSSINLTVGPFEVSPTSGVIEIGGATTITISGCLNFVKLYQESITITFNESPSLLQEKNEILLLAEGCIPKINFEDYNTIFREHYIARSEAEFTAPIKFESYTLFTEKNLLFSFKNVCLTKTMEARIYIPNSGFIECQLLIEIKSVDDDNASKGENCFNISSNTLLIEPYNFGVLTLMFRPEAIEDYRAKLVLSVEMPNKFENTTFAFDLFGNGVLPQIEIMEPPSKLLDGQTLVNFPPTTPKRSSTALIVCKNIGPLGCKVIVEICNNSDGVYTLFPRGKTENMLQLWTRLKPIDHTAIFSIFPDEVAEFNVIFTPIDTKSYASQIKLYIVDNPFENLCVKLTGEGFYEEVIIENIRTSIPFLAEDSIDLQLPSYLPSTHGNYNLNFSECCVRKGTKALLRLSNKTQRSYFRFVWDEMEHFTISPMAGHLYPNSYKEILITFLPSEPMELDDVALFCTLNKILLDAPPNVAWDSRLLPQHKPDIKIFTPSPEANNKKDNFFLSNMEDYKNNHEEVPYEIIPETCRTIVVNVSGTADYARLRCETTNILFKSTFMFQTRIFPLKLQNCGNITLEFNLTLSSVTTWPLREGKTTQVKEHLFIKEEGSRNRPQSWISSSDSSHVSEVIVPRSLRPRPLTSDCLLELKQNVIVDPAAEDSIFNEDEKPVLYNPFFLENSSGQITAGASATCNILFSPLDINEYKAILSIQVPNLHPDCKLPDIFVTATSTMPICHFNITESDYLESGRRDFSRPGPIGCAPGLPLHPDIKTIEIKTLGTGHTVPVKFHVINPLDEDYTFSWINITQIQPDTVQSFHCSTLDGRIQAGRQQQMTFNFVSRKIGITESFWKFCVPSYKLEAIFLFVGEVREPSVYFLSNHVNLRPNFIGTPSFGVLTLLNNEDTAFEFKFSPDSLYSGGRLNVLDVEPSSGKILPHSEFNIKITFIGKTGGKVMFSLKCNVKGASEVLTVAVETTTYVIQPLVVFEDFMKVKHNANSECDNFLNLGKELIPNRPEIIPFTITNISKTSFYYDWIYDKEILETCFCKLKFTTKTGHISSLSKGKCDLSVIFSKKSSLSNFPIKLKIRRGPMYTFILNAGASIPSCELSFSSFDFGYCFLQERDICYYEVPLTIRNTDTLDISLEGFLPLSSAFSVSLPETTIQPGHEMNVVINFCPKETIPYSDVLKLIVNGLHEKLINLKGCGTEFKVILENAKDTTICFGAVKIGNNSSQKFSLINKSLAPANLLIGFADQFPVNGNFLSKPEKNCINLAVDHRLTGIVTITPSRVFTIKPQQKFLITIDYTPQKVCCNFSETNFYIQKVCFQFQEKVEPLCLVTGCCIGPNISLDRSFINFGAVVKDCSSIMRLKLSNTGSIGAKFEWLTDLLGDEYDLSPTSGYCSPQSDVKIEIKFHPKAINNCTKTKVECRLQLSHNEMYPSLFLNLAGSCIGVPDPKDIIFFECFVRSSDIKTINIENWSGNEWQLLPIFNGEYFKGGDALVVQALSTIEYEISYSPLMMTPKGSFHEGSVFFRLPNGQGLLYKLYGVSLPPNPEEVIQRQIPCKTKYVELLKVRNWLQCPQRFKVQITCLTDPNQVNPLWNCSGLKSLDLPPMTEKEYNLNFFAYKPDNLRFNVHFINEVTQEYEWFDLTFNILMCQPLEVISLKCGVRQTCYHEIKLENPLDKAIQYKMTTANPEIHFEQTAYVVNPQSTIYVKISFTPIHVREISDQLIVECPELGIFPRELHLTSLSVQSEPPRTFETPLGSSQTQTITIKNLSHLNATLNCSTDSNEFLVAQVEHAGPGQEVDIEVVHEPSELTTTVANVFVDSSEAGKFVFPLVGICLKPLAKGPFLVRPGAGVTITFKNVFRKSKDFYMYVDNSAFVLKQSQENIAPKGECNISVVLQKEKYLEKLTDNSEGRIDSRFPFMGQLIVECYNPYVKWQFYLKGIIE